MSVTTARRDEETADDAGVERDNSHKKCANRILQLTDMKKKKL
jgi:hypothetical protein